MEGGKGERDGAGEGMGRGDEECSWTFCVDMAELGMELEFRLRYEFQTLTSSKVKI